MSKELDNWKDYLVNKEKTKAKELKEKKKQRLFLLLFELTLSIIGFTILYIHTNFWVCLALFLILWGNNMMVLRTNVTQKVYTKLWGEESNKN